MKNDLLMRFCEKYCLDEIDPAFVLDGINSVLNDCDCDEWLEKYLKDLRKGLRFHALKMHVRGADTETFEYLLNAYAVKEINLYCFDGRNQIFLIPEMEKRFPAFSLRDNRLWLSWAEKNQEEIRKRCGRV